MSPFLFYLAHFAVLAYALVGGVFLAFSDFIMRALSVTSGLGREQRLQDCRGTAATRLLNAGLSLSEIANHLGWSLRHAAK